ncbi:MAG TPA: ATP-binding protein [Terriglobia bacterium]|nr:ATP-binding protein [Terriglobia bacterium]
MSAPEPYPSPRSLARAFASFQEAAVSLESSYAQLQTEIAALRRELQERNLDLAQSLQENERIRDYLARILEALPCGVLVIDGDGRVRIENAAAQRLLGVAPEMTALQVPERVRCATPGCEQPWPEEGWKGGCDLAVTRALLPGSNGSREDSVLILRDVSDEKRLEREREAARRVQALAEMSMLLAHEIRNPLASLELFAGLLAEATAGQPEPRRWVDHLQAGLRALGATVNNVLQYHHQAPLQLAPVNLRGLLQEIVEFLSPLARQRGMSVEVAECHDAVFLQADSHRLRQVFLNLLLNSLRVMPEGGAVRITGRLAPEGSGGRIEILIQDQGPGIDPEKLPRIFEPGYSTHPGSPGLGLAVSKKIVEQHGGRISVCSIPGQGTTFRLEFPAAGGAQ